MRPHHHEVGTHRRRVVEDGFDRIAGLDGINYVDPRFDALDRLRRDPVAFQFERVDDLATLCGEAVAVGVGAVADMYRRVVVTR